jgi:hypothetical protein
MNSNFSDLLSKLNSQYVQKTHDAPGQSLQTNKIVIGKNDFDSKNKNLIQICQNSNFKPSEPLEIFGVNHYFNFLILRFDE